MSYGAESIYTELSTNTAITALVDDISQGRVPKDLGKHSTTINFYLLSPIDVSLPFNEAIYTVNCRAENYSTADDLANTVITELNRKFGDNYFLNFVKLPVIDPLDETDNFNAVIECKVRNT